MLLGSGEILHPESSFLLEPFYPNLKAHTNIACKKAACSKRFHIHPHPISKCFQFFFNKHNKTPAIFSGFPWFTPPGHPSAARSGPTAMDRARAKCPASGLAPLTSGRPGHGSMEEIVPKKVEDFYIVHDISIFFYGYFYIFLWIFLYVFNGYFYIVHDISIFFMDISIFFYGYFYIFFMDISI